MADLLLRGRRYELESKLIVGYLNDADTTFQEAAGAIIPDLIAFSVVFVLILLVMIAVGVWQIVKVSVVWGGFQKLLEEGEYSRGSKRVRKGLVSGIYWAVVVALYLGYSFVTFRWDRSWIIWPIAAVLYAVVIKIEEAVYNRKNNK